MISKDLLKAIANEMPLYQQEKDYLLKLFLFHYYRLYDDAIFKGGTCIKYSLGLQRFSEDLDFNIKNKTKFKEQVTRVMKEIGKIGINHFFSKEESFEDAYACEISFEGPLYNGDIRNRNKIRIDAGYRAGTVRKPVWNLIHSVYPETGENFLALCMDTEEILVEKILAAMKRAKGRDLYDIWFLIKIGTKLDAKLLKSKARKEKTALNISAIASKQDYERDMSRLTNRLIPYEQVRSEVVSFLKYVTQ